MRETVGEFQEEWIKTNGETDGLEVLLQTEDSDYYLYKGCFAGIPEEFLDRKVLRYGQVMASSIPEHAGAYKLTIK